MDHSMHQDPKGQGQGGMEGMKMEGMEMKPKVTGPEIAAVTLLTLLALTIGVVVPAFKLNLGLGEMHSIKSALVVQIWMQSWRIVKWPGSTCLPPF